MTACKECGSMAINHHLYSRDGSDPDLCDVDYWKKRAFVWKPIDSGLPIDPKIVKNYDAIEVVVALDPGEVCSATYSCGNVVNEWHQFSALVQGVITHWAPLPEPPHE